MRQARSLWSPSPALLEPDGPALSAPQGQGRPRRAVCQALGRVSYEPVWWLVRKSGERQPGAAVRRPVLRPGGGPCDTLPSRHRDKSLPTLRAQPLPL